MATELGSRLPQDLQAALEDSTFETLAVPLLTTDRQGYPHVALLSFLELIPCRRERLAFFIHPGSRTASFLQKNRICTLIFAGEHFAYYLKGAVRFVGLIEGVVVFVFTVETALQDRPGHAEEDTFLISGLRFKAPESEIGRRRSLREKVASQLSALLPSVC